MNDQSRPKIAPSLLGRTIIAVTRSLISTALIILVAAVVFVFREGYFTLRMIGEVAGENAPLFEGIFLGLVVWNVWLR